MTGKRRNSAQSAQAAVKRQKVAAFMAPWKGIQPVPRSSLPVPAEPSSVQPSISKPSSTSPVLLAAVSVQNINTAGMDLVSAVETGLVLVESGNDIHVMDKMSGASLLHMVARHGYRTLFIYLDMRGLDPNKLDNKGKTVLHWACIGGQYDMAIFLMNKYPCMKDQLDVNKESILHSAAASGNIELFEYLIDQGYDRNCISISEESVFHTACLFASCDIARYLATKFPDLKNKTDIRGWTALFYAAIGGCIDILQYLIEQDLDVYHEPIGGENVLMMACMTYEIENSLEVVKYLVTRFPKLLDTRSKCNLSALHYAALAGNVETFNYLSKNGLGVHELGKDNCTVLHLACEKGNYELVKHLATAHPELTPMETTGGETALLIAARRKKDDIIVCLVDNMPGILEQTLAKSVHSGQVHYLKTFTLTKFLALKAELDKNMFVKDPAQKHKLKDHELVRRWFEEVTMTNGAPRSGVFLNVPSVTKPASSPHFMEQLLCETRLEVQNEDYSFYKSGLNTWTNVAIKDSIEWQIGFL